MSFTNGQFGDDRYLIYQFGENDIIETMSFGQITNNTIDGLAPATFTQMDTTKSIMYKITSKISLEDFLQKPIKKKQLLKVLSGIIRAIRSAQEYMIDPSVILLDKEYIFLKLSTFEMHMICLPVANPGYRNMGLQAFLWELVAKTAKDKSESREYVSELMEKLDASEPLSLDEIESVLESFSQKEAQPAPAPKPEPRVAKPFKPEPPKPEPQPFKPAPQPPKQDMESQFGPGYDPLSNNSKPSSSPWDRLFKRSEKAEKPKKEDKRQSKNTKKEPSFEAIPGAMFEVPSAPRKEQEIPDMNIPGGKPSADRFPGGFAIPGASPVPAEPMARRQPVAPKHEVPAPVFDRPNIPSTNYAGTVVLRDEGNETMLEQQISSIPVSMKMNAHLVRESNNEIIPIKGTVFQIGSDYEYSDYQISNNKTVGDTHARIIVHQNEYYIKDINSKNRTYVDDKAIPSMVETKLNHGSRVRLGTERFVFQLY